MPAVALLAACKEASELTARGLSGVRRLRSVRSLADVQFAPLGATQAHRTRARTRVRLRSPLKIERRCELASLELFAIMFFLGLYGLEPTFSCACASPQLAAARCSSPQLAAARRSSPQLAAARCSSLIDRAFCSARVRARCGQLRRGLCFVCWLVCCWVVAPKWAVSDLKLYLSALSQFTPPQIKCELSRVRRNTPHIGPAFAWRNRRAFVWFSVLRFELGVPNPIVLAFCHQARQPAPA